MKSYIDINNFHLGKYVSQEYLDKYSSTWFFFDKEDILESKNIFDSHKKVYSFLWEYSDDNYSIKIDEWKRAFKRNNIQIPSDINLYTRDCLFPRRKIYLDIIETDLTLSDELFKNVNIHNCGKHLAQLIVKENVNFSDLNFNFLDRIDSKDRFIEFIKILDLEDVCSIVLNGYHHRGELIKIIIHRKSNDIVNQSDMLLLDIFENTYVSKAFSWESE
ncbi:hypothetical protein [Chryseobacterium polytrichastri]|uniref:Uncharacterized protein n=1 Tax=Chryseobacterium polytrichastri TaxID=1302687 RepID=A0A1M6SFX9_9FLAO|nr:hypothetical protein [Chryseobacterium polytrichastri]SHK43652.1 hypothetical protein SAMN05444267_100418 [Chryseobacterium polytrichastri]